MTYSVTQLCERYAVARGKVLAWIASGELQAINVAMKPGGQPRWRISQESLDAFELRRSSQPQPKPAPRRKIVRNWKSYV